MSTIEIAGKRRGHVNRPPITFAEWFVVLNGCVPLIMMMWDARLHQLGSDPIRRAIHITGTIAIVLLLATLCITPLRQWTKWNWVHGFRRPLGMMAFFYAVGHLLIYVGLDRQWDWQDAWQEFLSRRFLQFGALSLTLLVPLAITSSPRMIRWLTMRRWRRLHRLIYPATVAATIHLMMQSKVSIKFQSTVVIVLTMLMLVRLAVQFSPKRKFPARELSTKKLLTEKFSAPESAD